MKCSEMQTENKNILETTAMAHGAHGTLEPQQSELRLRSTLAVLKQVVGVFQGREEGFNVRRVTDPNSTRWVLVIEKMTPERVKIPFLSIP